MLPEDRWPEQVAGSYSRADVQRFLEEAEAARERAEALLDIATQRRRLLAAQLADVLEGNARIEQELSHAAREIGNDRLSRANAVAVVLASAEADAAAILAQADDEVAAVWAQQAPSEAAANPHLILVPSSGALAPTEPPLLVS